MMQDNLSVNWFDSCKNNITSQTGEDGILERIFEIIPGNVRWCCEFGAWDGKKYSNTYQLLANKGWFGVLIEADSIKFQELPKTFGDNNKIKFFNRFVNFSGKDTLDEILAETSIPLNFDLLSIDIDGNDYHIWDSLVKYSPKVVIIEYNQSIANHIEYVQKPDVNINHGNSILSITKLAKSKGYELVAVTDLNGIYVKQEFYSLFGINDNSLEKLRPFAPYVTDVFQFYDGTLAFSGYQKMIWHNLPIVASKQQVVPWYLRSFPGLMSKMKLNLLRVLRIIKN
jgi:hypothetical protein